uniref:Uncharacterized protein n=1 Tax=Parascaris univalens TaxID=6257 RepID=A0A915BNW7_PARUN
MVSTSIHKFIDHLSRLLVPLELPFWRRNEEGGPPR